MPRIFLSCALALAAAACADSPVERSPQACAAADAGLSVDPALVEAASAADRIRAEMTKAWPGFWRPDQAFMVYCPKGPVLLVSSSPPPEGFRPLPDSLVPEMLSGRAHLHPGPLPGLEGAFAIDFPAGSITVTAVAVGGETVASTVTTLFHEAFHGYQARRFVRELPSTGEFVEPRHVAHPEFRALAELERRMLVAALELSADALHEHLRGYLAVRALRARAVPADVRAVERYIERSEGSAHLVGLEAGLLAAGEGRSGLANAVIGHLSSPLESRAGGLAERLIRWRVYGTGAAIGLLLDRMDVPWRHRLEEGATFEDLLAAAVDFDRILAPALAEQALERFGYAELLADALSSDDDLGIHSLSDFLALAPVRLVVELQVPLEDGRPQMDVNFTGAFSQIEPNLFALQDPEVVSMRVPGGSIVVHARPLLWDLRQVAAGRMTATVLLPALPESAAGRSLSPGEHQLERFELDIEGVRLTLKEPVSVQLDADRLTVRPQSP